MTMTPEQATWFAETFGKLVGNIGQAVLGKTARDPAGAHLPARPRGTCCSRTSRAPARRRWPRRSRDTVAGHQHRGSSSRPTCCPPTSPAYHLRPAHGAFEFHPGPIFASIVLADEINRASPKTQSALLEVMEEAHVTVDGVTHAGRRAVHGDRHPEPDRAGRHLPAARGAARPVPDEDLARLPGPRSRPSRSSRAPSASATGRQIVPADHRRRRSPTWPRSPATVHVDPAVLRLHRAARRGDPRRAPRPASASVVRGCLALVRAAKTWAAAHGRHFVVPDDVKELAEPVLAHRLVLDPEAEFAGATAARRARRGARRRSPPPQERRTVA